MNFPKDLRRSELARHFPAMSTGVFHTAKTGHRPRRVKRKRDLDPIDRFAEMLSDHDTETGNVGGSITLTSSRMGITTKVGYRMFGRIVSQLGRQAQ